MTLKSHKINKVLVLGSGTSTGIPVLGCDCSTCVSPAPKDLRTRTSILIQSYDGKHILVDTGPDLRTQLLREKITFIDSVILTHDHADHIHGIDDLRPFTFQKDHYIKCITHPDLVVPIRMKFSYIFDRASPSFAGKKVIGGGIPRLILEAASFIKTSIIEKLEFKFYSLPHGYGQTLGFRQDSFAYIIDCHEIPENVIRDLKEAKLDLLIIDAVNKTPHKTHLYYGQALSYASEIGAKNTRLIHMSHHLPHHELEKGAVPGAFDGEVLEYSLRT